jgi:hypothetical protein
MEYQPPHTADFWWKDQNCLFDIQAHIIAQWSAQDSLEKDDTEHVNVGLHRERRIVTRRL